jgi:RHS repeat-associated protein
MVALMGLLVLTGSLQAAKLVTDSLPGLPGQSDAYWAERRQEQAEPQKGQGQFVNLREVTVKQDVVYQENEPVNFYTGKPYDVELGTYVFKYRNYNPEIQRWTTMDPSGFPDGANNYCYVKIPLIAIDCLGLKEVIIEDVNYYQMTVTFNWAQATVGVGTVVGGAITSETGAGAIVMISGIAMIATSVSTTYGNMVHDTTLYGDVDNDAILLFTYTTSIKEEENSSWAYNLGIPTTLTKVFRVEITEHYVWYE